MANFCGSKRLLVLIINDLSKIFSFTSFAKASYIILGLKINSGIIERWYDWFFFIKKKNLFTFLIDEFSIPYLNNIIIVTKPLKTLFIIICYSEQLWM